MEALDLEAMARNPLLADLAALACTTADTPIGAICLADGTGQWHVAAHGADATHIPDSLAAAALTWIGAVMVVDDTAQDARLSADPDVGHLGLGSCAAAPIASPEGEVIGCVCALDTAKRPFAEPAIEGLGVLARQVERQLDRAVEQHHLRDLSVRLVDSELALSQTLERLETSNRDLEKFAFYVAHELQAPLHAVNVFAEILEQAARGSGVEPDLISAAAQNVGTEAQHLAEKVSSLFALSQFSVADEPRRTIALAPVLNQVVAGFADAVGTIEVRCEPAVQVLGDEIALETVIANLLSNTSRYRHPERELEVGIAVTTDDDDGTATISVSDNGVGIAPADVDRIFDAFQRLDRSGSGAGIGLTLCRRIVEGLGGHLGVSSELDVGTTFSVSLPSA